MSSRKKTKSSTSNTTQYRTFQVIEEREEGDAPPVKRGVLVTEAPVSMPDWERMEMVDEVLVADGAKFRGDTLKLVDSHGVGTVRNVLGAFRDIRKMPATEQTPFKHFDGIPDISKAEPDIRTKFDEGFINEMSVGYDIDPARSTFVPEGETYNYKGRTYTGPVHVREVWYAREASLVGLGADDLALVRGYKSWEDACQSKQVDSLEDEEQITRTISTANAPPKIMSESITTQDSPAVPAQPKVSQDAARENHDAALAADRQRVAAIGDLADSYKCREDGRKAIESGMSTEAFVASIRGKLAGPGPVLADPLPWSERESKKWSLGRAAQLLADGKQLDGLEAEVNQEIGRRTNKTTRGIFLPNPRDIRQFGRADVTLTAGTATDGAELVPTRTSAQDYVPFFTPNPVMWDLGARVITGVTENFNVPVESSTATAGTAAEDAAHAESQPQFATKSFTPKAYGFFTEITKRLLYQSATATEQILTTIMNRQMTIAFDKDGFNGNGSTECDGIIDTFVSGAPTVTITTAGTITYANILEFEEDVETNNALENSCAYVTTPAIKKALKQLQVFSSTDTPVWSNTNVNNLGESIGMVNGYRAVSSNQVPANGFIFGDFNFYWYVIFDGAEIVITEDAGLAKRRAVQFTCNIDIDGQKINNAAFSNNVS